VKSLGASEVFDYHDPDVVHKIRTAAGSGLSLVYDCISENGSAQASIACITAPSGNVALILPPPADLSTVRVKVVFTGAGPAARDKAIGERVYGLLIALLERHAILPNQVRVIPGGLLGVNEGLQLGREHKVSGEKLVYRVADTKF